MVGGGVTTAGMILRDDLAGIGAHAVEVVSRGTVVPRLPPLTRDAVLGQVQASFTALHDITVGDVLKLAWSACQTLRRVARESLATSRPQAFHLDGYAVPVEYQPAVDVLVGGKRIATIHFGLCLTLELFHIDGIADRGRLVRLQTQTFDVTASLTMAGRTLASRKTRLNLAVEFPLPADGLPLVRN